MRGKLVVVVVARCKLCRPCHVRPASAAHECPRCDAVADVSKPGQTRPIGFKPIRNLYVQASFGVPAQPRAPRLAIDALTLSSVPPPLPSTPPLQLCLIGVCAQGITRPTPQLAQMIAAWAAAPQMLASAQLLQLQVEQGVDYLASLKTSGLGRATTCNSTRCGPTGFVLDFSGGRGPGCDDIAAGRAPSPSRTPEP